LDAYLPFTSKDCDIGIGWAALKYFKAKKGGSFTNPPTFAYGND